MKQYIFTFFLLLTGISFAQNTTLIGSLNPQASAGYNDIWGYVDSQGNEYALLGCRNGVSIISLANPSNPVEVKFFPGQFTIWRDIKVHGQYAYVTADQSTEGLWIIDLSGLPNTATLVTKVTTWFQRAHNIFIDNGYAYVIGTEDGGGMHILNLANPTNPVRTAYYTASGYIHDVYVWGDTVVACAGNSQNFHLVSVKNKSNPQLISQSAPLPGIYAHSGWMTEDKRYFIGCEEFNERDIMIWDLQDRTSWDLILPQYHLPGGSRVHNLFIKGNYAHISYYGEGYVVLDISEPSAPVKVAQYDSYPGSNGGFDGAWGVYPYLPSGLILESDTETGLYVIQFTPTNVAPNILHEEITEILEPTPVNISAIIADDDSVTQARLYYRTFINGNISSWISVADQNGPNQNIYEFQIPAQPHLSRVEYYIAAQDMQNQVTTLPAGGSGTNPPGSTPPADPYSYQTIIAGTPVLYYSFPQAGDTTIARNGRADFLVMAEDTSQLGLTYKWYRNSQLSSDNDSAFTYVSIQVLPAPRTDTVFVQITNGYRSVSKKWLVHVTSSTSVGDEQPITYEMGQNYPNPFNPSTTISFSIAQEEFVNLSVYNMLGEKVDELINSSLKPGSYSREFKSNSLTSGTYFARIETASFKKTIKMSLLK